MTLVADDADWAVGTIASCLVDYSSQVDTELAVVNANGWSPRLVHSTLRTLARSDVIHWLSTGEWIKHHNPYLAGRSIVSLHHIDETESWRCSIPSGRRLVTHSAESSQRIAEICGAAPDVVLPYGFDPRLFSRCGEREKMNARERFGFERESYVAGCFGNAASWRKDIPLLIEWLRASSSSVKLSLLVAGRGWEEHMPQLAETVHTAVYAPASSYDEMRIRFASLDVYLCSSLVEGGPLPVLEALACGVPVVSTRVGHVEALLGGNGAEIPNVRMVGGEPHEVAGHLRDLFGGVAPGQPATFNPGSVALWSWAEVALQYAEEWERVISAAGQTSRTEALARYAVLAANRAGGSMKRRAQLAGKRMKRWSRGS